MSDLVTVDRQLGEGEEGGDTGGVLGGDSSVVNTGSPPLDIVMSGQLLQAAEVHNSPHSQLCPVPGHWGTMHCWEGSVNLVQFVICTS